MTSPCQILTPSERKVFAAASATPLYCPPVCSLTLMRSRGCPTITRHMPGATGDREGGG